MLRLVAAIDFEPGSGWCIRKMNDALLKQLESSSAAYHKDQGNVFRVQGIERSERADQALRGATTADKASKIAQSLSWVAAGIAHALALEDEAWSLGYPETIVFLVRAKCR